MNNDITHILSTWEYDPNQVNARFVTGPDGRTRIQLRMDLGVFQMEPDGRPDGQRPRGADTLLEYYRTLAKTTKAGKLKLDGEACAELQLESVQFYYRYLARMQLKDFAGVMADTRHNLAIFDQRRRCFAESRETFRKLHFCFDHPFTAESLLAAASSSSPSR